jgi:protein-histidine pros-kinase
MKLIVKFNLVLIVVLTVGLLLSGVMSYSILQNNARQEIVERAGMLMEAAMAVRSYTVNEIRPLLAKQMQKSFLPQTVPAYAATQAFNKMRETHPEYSYKEATLNPTNPRNRATDWEADIVQAFRNRTDNEVIGERSTPTGDSLYLARPIKIKDGGCLVCHSTVEVAPPTMLARYGDANGFGWKMDEIIGAQIVSVPMSVPVNAAKKAFYTFMGLLAGVFVFTIVVMNLMLRLFVIKPVTSMSHIADEISRGKMDTAEFSEKGNDEISLLGSAFNRMRRSLEKAMKMLGE